MEFLPHAALLAVGAIIGFGAGFTLCRSKREVLRGEIRQWKANYQEVNTHLLHVREDERRRKEYGLID